MTSTPDRLRQPRTEADATTLREHFWISNPAFYRMTGIKWICMDCRIGVARRTDVGRKTCPGRPIAGIGEPTGAPNEP